MAEADIDTLIVTPDGDTSWGNDMRGAMTTLKVSDAAAATTSRRTLGTGATQAAAGNHTHANVPYYLTWTTVGQTRPTWSGPVVWVGNYTTMGSPTNRIAGDHIMDTGA